MPQDKDLSEKILEDYNDVFADIVNALVFDGKEVIYPDELENAQTVSQLKMEDGLHQQERDTAKRWKRGTITLAAWGLENQSASDAAMPLRVAGYDGAVYKEQVSRRHSDRRQGREPMPFYPSITVVLYFGTTRWSGPRSLRDCFHDMPGDLEPLVPDYPLHVVEVAFLTPEQRGRLKSDFRYVADFLAQTRTGGNYVPEDGPIIHVDETLKLLGALSDDNRYLEALNSAELAGKEGAAVNMRYVIDNYIAQGRQEAAKEYEAVLADKDRTIAEQNRTIGLMMQELRELRLHNGQAQRSWSP